VAGAVVAAGSAERDAAQRFADAWIEGDHEAMYAELGSDSAARFSREEFEQAYTSAERTATISSIAVGELRGPLDQDGEQVVVVPLELATESFGPVSDELGIPVADDGLDWRPNLVFPGLERGEELARETTTPERAPILGSDRSVLAEGPVDARTTTGRGGIVIGEVGQPPTERAQQMRRQGFPEGTKAGTTGLELAFDEDLAGTPGGTLFAVGSDRRPLASSPPTEGKPLRTTIDPAVQEIATAALGGQFGGVAVLDARNGEVRGLAGIALSAPQPPGSSFKIITLTGALEEGLAKPGTEFPVLTSTNVGGRAIDNAHEEPCGGTLTTSFALSCNTVFAPLGTELGAEKLLELAEAFGFNAAPTIYGPDALAAAQPASSTIPDPIGSELDTGVSAIGQGQVLATPLQMASIAQTIANRGVRSPTSLVKDAALASEVGEVEVTTPRIAAQVGEMMVEVVRSGTGSAAALPETSVAGKTGTAELGPKPDQMLDPDDPEAEPELEVDAWFVAYAPAGKPKLAVAVMIVNADGDGGVIAAPIARQILQEAL
jgi:cell division protein FtsI/penicillin-binding protein 2